MAAIADALENVFISGLVPGPVVTEPSASEGVAVKPTEPIEDAKPGTKATLKGVGIGVAFSVFVGVLGLQIYVTKHRTPDPLESSEPQREPTPAERGEAKIRAASELLESIPHPTTQELNLVVELWRQGAELLTPSDEPSDKDLASKLTLDLALQIQDRKEGTKHAVQLATRAAQWREEQGNWALAVEAQEQAVKIHKTADDAPELGWAQDCLASLRAKSGCEWQRPSD